MTSVCLAILTSGCVSNPAPAPTVVTKYERVYLPDRFFQHCQKAEWAGGTYRSLAGLAITRGTQIDNCNAQLDAAKGYQDDLKGQEKAILTN